MNKIKYLVAVPRLMIGWNDMMFEGDINVLWGTVEPSVAIIGSMCHVILCEYVDAQRGSCCDVDAGGYRTVTATSSTVGAIGVGEQV